LNVTTADDKIVLVSVDGIAPTTRQITHDYLDISSIAAIQSTNSTTTKPKKQQNQRQKHQQPIPRRQRNPSLPLNADQQPTLEYGVYMNISKLMLAALAKCRNECESNPRWQPFATHESAERMLTGAPEGSYVLRPSSTQYCIAAMFVGKEQKSPVSLALLRMHVDGNWSVEGDDSTEYATVEILLEHLRNDSWNQSEATYNPCIINRDANSLRLKSCRSNSTN